MLYITLLLLYFSLTLSIEFKGLNIVLDSEDNGSSVFLYQGMFPTDYSTWRMASELNYASVNFSLTHTSPETGEVAIIITADKELYQRDLCDGTLLSSDITEGGSILMVRHQLTSPTVSTISADLPFEAPPAYLRLIVTTCAPQGTTLQGDVSVLNPFGPLPGELWGAYRAAFLGSWSFAVLLAGVVISTKSKGRNSWYLLSLAGCLALWVFATFLQWLGLSRTAGPSLPFSESLGTLLNGLAQGWMRSLLLLAASGLGMLAPDVPSSSLSVAWRWGGGTAAVYMITSLIALPSYEPMPLGEALPQDRNQIATVLRTLVGVAVWGAIMVRVFEVKRCSPPGQRDPSTKYWLTASVLVVYGLISIVIDVIGVFTTLFTHFDSVWRSSNTVAVITTSADLLMLCFLAMVWLRPPPRYTLAPTSPHGADEALAAELGLGDDLGLVIRSGATDQERAVVTMPSTSGDTPAPPVRTSKDE